MAASGAGGEQVYATVRPLSALSELFGAPIRLGYRQTDSEIASSERFLPPWSVNYFQLASIPSRHLADPPPGALVLAHSLRDAGTHRKLAVLVTLDSVSADSITQLKVSSQCPTFSRFAHVNQPPPRRFTTTSFPSRAFAMTTQPTCTL